jgi:hypothetical protein
LLLPRWPDVAWAPDSRRLAYPAVHGIRTINRDGSSERTVTRVKGDHSVQWSPDGHAIAFLRASRVRASRNLMVLRGRVLRVVARGVTNGFTWSPDGRRLAFVGGTTIHVVDRDGRRRRPLVETPDGARRPLWSPVWSPSGRLIAYVDRDGLHVVDVASKAKKSLWSGQASDVAWTPRGDALAFVDERGAIELVRPDGRVNILRPEDPVRFGVWGLAWTTPPRGTAYRTPSPVNFPVEVSPTELKLKTESTIEIAADGNRVGFLSCGWAGLWTPGQRSIAPATSGAVPCADSTGLGGNRVWGPALAGDVFGYGTACCTTSSIASLRIFRVAAIEQANISGPPSLGIGSPSIGFLLGHGPLLVFSIWQPGTSCNGPGTPCPDPRGQTLWRLPIPFSSGACFAEPGSPPAPPCVKISAGPAVPLAVDDTRVVVRRLDGSIAVLDASGHELLTLPLNTGEGTAAAIAGSDLIILVDGALRDYDAITGAFLHEWAMPSVPIGGFCGIYLERCGSPELRLEDAARGLAAYILAGRLHLLRLRDGADAVIGEATAAQLEDEGLFFAYRGASPYKGRIRFVPFDQLAVR